MANGIQKDLGKVTAYSYAKAAGYTGTEEQFQAIFNEFTENAPGLIDRMDTAVERAESAVTNIDATVQDAVDDAVEEATASAVATANQAVSDAQAAQAAAEGAVTQANAAVTQANNAVTAAQAAQSAAEDAAESFVLDRTLTDSGAAAPADLVGDLKESLTLLDGIVSLDDTIPLPFKIEGSGYISSAGKVGSSPNFEHTDYVDISNYKTITYTKGGLTSSSAQYTAIYDANKTKTRTIRWASNQSAVGYLEQLDTIEVQSGEVYARFTTYTDTDAYGEFHAYINATPLSKKFESIDNSLDEKTESATQTGINLFDASKAVSGYINSNGNVSSGSDYLTSEFIPIKENQTVYVNRVRTFMAYDTSKAPISDSYISSLTNNITFTASQDGFIRASLFVSYADSNIIAYGGKPLYYEPYNQKTVVDPNIHLSNTMINDAIPFTGNVLDGKKWVACGDSFTHGDFQRSMTDDYTFTDSPYYGQNKVYPFWIGRRNQGLTVINEAISGSTMTAGESGVNPFSGDRYTSVPSDADYITLMFGINDSGNSCPIGTIDDNDNTTFYGAWNVVLNYFITNFPYAHIGIIVGPGMQTSSGQQYANAEIAVAKKWGIPYLNIQFESGGENIPLMLRTSNPDVSAAAKALRNSQQYVNNQEGTTNMHPNEKAHEFGSTFIEAWLRTL